MRATALGCMELLEIMTSRDFCYWLQGYFELSNDNTVPADKVQMIRRHLTLVFKHEIDPSIPDPTGELQKIHDGPKIGGVGPEGQVYRC